MMTGDYDLFSRDPERGTINPLGIEKFLKEKKGYSLNTTYNDGPVPLLLGRQVEGTRRKSGLTIPLLLSKFPPGQLEIASILGGEPDSQPSLLLHPYNNPYLPDAGITFVHSYKCSPNDFSEDNQEATHNTLGWTSRDLSPSNNYNNPTSLNVSDRIAIVGPYGRIIAAINIVDLRQTDNGLFTSMCLHY
jgi:hypothetical protein